MEELNMKACKQNPATKSIVLSRRNMMASCILGGLGLMALGGAAYAKDSDGDMLFGDPEAPTGGNLAGDLVLVIFTDYNCPYCKKVAKPMHRSVEKDGNVKIIYKDWPVITPISVDFAQLALAAKYQNKYEDAHYAIMGITERRPPIAKVEATMQSAGVDMVQLKKDLQTHSGAIKALLGRNNEQAEALGIRGTPAFIIGNFLIPGVLPDDKFAEVFAEARKNR